MLNKLKTIMLQHKGQANAITSTELAKLLGIKENATHANTRQLVLKCAKECMLPIASTRKGYFIIETKDECKAYLDNLNKRAQKIQERKDIIMINFMD